MESGSSHLPPSKLEKLFLHFFDIHFLEEKGRSVETDYFVNEMRLATRLAIASATTVFIPAASYFESPLCRAVLHDFRELIELGCISLSGSSPNLDFFIQERQDIKFYREASKQNSAYRSGEVYGPHSPPYVPRSRSATRDIVESWNRSVRDDVLPRMLYDAANGPIAAVEARLERVPGELGTLAFIPEHVFDILDLGQHENLMHARIRSVINEAYFSSYVRDLAAGVVIDLRFLAAAFRVPSAGRNLSYAKMIRFLCQRKKMEKFRSCEALELLQFGEDVAWQLALQDAVTYVERRVSDVSNEEKRVVSHSAISGSTYRSDTVGAEEGDQFGETKSVCNVLCVAAASVEFAAVRGHFDAEFGQGKRTRLDTEGKYYGQQYTDPKTGAVWNVVPLSFQGEVEAVDSIHRLRTVCKPTAILMVGMCMGIPAHELAVGTVVIPNEVIAFDHQRQKASGTVYRPHGTRTDTGLYRLAKMIASDSDLSYPVVPDKGLASATVKIEDPEATLVTTIHASHPDVVAFDMEGWGFYSAREGEEYLWIKAVADSGEPQGQSGGKRKKKHTTQASVTKNAADFAIRLIRDFVSASQVIAKYTP